MYTLGHSHHGHPLVLDEPTRRIHAAFVGATGTGKSTLLENLMRSDMEAGRGFALIDPHGDLAQAVANATPPNRINDVLYLDPMDATHAVGFNPLTSNIEASVLTSHIVSACKHIWKDSWGPRMQYILGMAIRLLLSTPKSSIVMLPRLGYTAAAAATSLISS